MEYEKRAINAVYFRSGSTKHEIAKAVGALMLSRCGIAVFTDPLKEILTSLANEIDAQIKVCIEMSGNNPAWFITEAQERTKSFSIPTGTVNPTRDLVCLDDGVRYEFETKKSRAKRHENDRAIVVVQL
jgi:hypothetical protein